MIATFAAVFVSLLVAHTLGDHWVQTSHQAAHKGARDLAGALACLRHVLTYTATTTAFVGATWFLLGLPITWVGLLLGQAVSAITHYWADRRWTLAWLARVTGKSTFARLGVPCDGHNDKSCLGTGAYALDQSFHWLWLWVAAIVTAVV